MSIFTIRLCCLFYKIYNIIIIPMLLFIIIPRSNCGFNPAIDHNSPIQIVVPILPLITIPHSDNDSNSRILYFSQSKKAPGNFPEAFFLLHPIYNAISAATQSFPKCQDKAVFTKVPLPRTVLFLMYDKWSPLSCCLLRK